MQTEVGFEHKKYAARSRTKQQGAVLRHLIAGLAVGVGTILGSSAAYAIEGGTFGAPIGGTDIHQAYLPSSTGFYGAIVGAYSESPNFHDQYGDISKTANPASLYAGVAAAGVLYVWPYNPLGFTVASSSQIGYIDEHQQLTIAGKTKAGWGNGLVDMFADLFYASHYIGNFGAVVGNNPRVHYGLTGAFGLAFEIPIGTYDVNQFVNPGKNTFITVPNFALTYDTALSFFDATEISGRFFFDTSARNMADGYQNGNLIDLDFSVTQRWQGYQFGLAGDYAQQITNDHGTNGLVQPPDGDRYEKIDLGPVFAWDAPPPIGGAFKAKITFPVFHTNNYNNTAFILAYSRKLF